MELVLFWIFGLAAVLGGLFVILPVARNPLYSALALVGTFVALAGVYVLLAAHLVAVMQILVYAGAIMVLFIFVIMLLNLRPEELQPRPLTVSRVLGAIAAVFVVTRLALMIAPGPVSAATDIAAPVAQTAQGLAVDYGSVKHIAGSLFRDFLVPFELLSIVLLVAVIGAVVLARKSKPAIVPEEAP